MPFLFRNTTLHMDEVEILAMANLTGRSAEEVEDALWEADDENEKTLLMHKDGSMVRAGD